VTNADDNDNADDHAVKTGFSAVDEPTDLTLDAEEKAALRLRQRLATFGARFPVGVRQCGVDRPEREREPLDPRPSFGFRQLAVKTENC
jgi:hypothetical protein